MYILIIYLSVDYLFINTCLSTYLSIYLQTHIYLSICETYLCTYLSIYLFVRHVYLPIYLSICETCLSTYLSICLCFHLQLFILLIFFVIEYFLFCCISSRFLIVSCLVRLYIKYYLDVNISLLIRNIYNYSFITAILLLFDKSYLFLFFFRSYLAVHSRVNKFHLFLNVSSIFVRFLSCICVTFYT